ncbi:ferric reductase [Scheffersomyces coipomensis]|uniref:ferric reductase n=1 Tax=Scheffersomyces coipomensis TaxID=1788519 RepID=UPI00315D4E55
MTTHIFNSLDQIQGPGNGQGQEHVPDPSKPSSNFLVDFWLSFHYPKGKSREYEHLRQETTNKYGLITTGILIIFVLLIPINRYAIKHGYNPGQFRFLRSINSKLNGAIQSSNFLKSYISLKVKLALVYLIYHISTIIQIIFWLTVLSSLSLVDIYHGDLIFLAKRLGRICTVCLPTVLFLSLRPSPLPNTLYLTLLPIHKWLSRIIIIQAIIHTFLYLGYFQYKNTWFKLYKYENLYGWAAILGFIIIIITSVSKLRNKYYKLFYINHYIWSWVIVICLQFHVRPYKITNYTIANIAILSYQIYYRLTLTTKLDSLRVVDVSPNLSLVEFPRQCLRNLPTKPGSHLRLTNYHPNFIVRAYKQLIPNYHPYTLVSLPQDSTQKLIIRQSNFKLLNNKSYLITGSYDPHLLFVNSKQTSNETFSISKLTINAKRILIIIGGSAISFALPILRVMNYHGIPCKIIWVIKDFRDITILKFFDGFIHGDDFEIFITGKNYDDANINSTKYLRNRMSYGSILSKSTITNHTLPPDLELGEQSLLIPDSSNDLFDEQEVDEEYLNFEDDKHNTLNYENENENVEISVGNEESDDDASDSPCEIEDYSYRSFTQSAIADDDHEDDNDDDDEEEEDYDDGLLHPNSQFEVHNYEQEVTYDQSQQSIKIKHITSPTHSRKSSINEPFILNTTSTSNSALKQFRETIRRLNIENKIFKGRPKLNYKYYNWCINEGFTQCIGPQHDHNNNIVCCRDLPQNKVKQEDINAENIWVISAGPKPLVENVKLWANENGLKFHEEAFYS